MAALFIASFLTGQHDYSGSAGERYSPAERMTGLHVGIYCGMGGAALLAYLLMSNMTRSNLTRNVACGVGVGVNVLAVLFSASRGPTIALFAAAAVSLLLSKGRGAVRVAVAMLLLGGIVLVGWEFVPELAKERLAHSVAGEDGLEGRGQLFASSFNILGVLRSWDRRSRLSP